MKVPLLNMLVQMLFVYKNDYIEISLPYLVKARKSHEIFNLVKIKSPY